jgi:acetyl-CoA acyltransferase
VNTGGGLIGFGHPVGATGVKQPLEIFRQMKGRCGDYQVAATPRWGLTANMGGDDKTSCRSRSERWMSQGVHRRPTEEA